jgi:hypothetical protein
MDARGEPDVKLDLKEAGKRPASMTGSGDSSPSQAISRRPVVCHTFIVDFSFFLLTLHPGFMILACTFQGDEHECVTSIPGL